MYFVCDFSNGTSILVFFAQVRYRKWHRISCPVAEKEAFDQQQEDEERKRANERAEALSGGGNIREADNWYPGKFIRKAYHKVKGR